MLYRIRKISGYCFKNIRLLVTIVLCILLNLIMLRLLGYANILLYSMGSCGNISAGFLIPFYLAINFFYIYFGLKLFFEELCDMFEFIFLRYNMYKWLFEKLLVVFINTIVVSLTFFIEIGLFMIMAGYNILFAEFIRCFIIIVLLKFSLQLLSIMLFLLFGRISILMDCAFLVLLLIIKSQYFELLFASYYLENGIAWLLVLSTISLIALVIIFKRRYRRCFDDKSK